MKINEIVDAAMKRVKPDLVLKNANIINVFTHEIIQGDIAVSNGTIVGVGNYNGEKNIDYTGKYVAPGLIDAHVHIESSMLSPQQFAKAIVTRGTTTIIADPHEISNVCGLNGIEYILNATEKLPLDVYVMLPSCVPATKFENSGALLNAEELEKFMNNPRVLGLGEMMNYPGLISNDEGVLKKLKLFKDKIIDGHAPCLKVDELNAYIASGVMTDHECSIKDEMIEKLRMGMYILVREGSAAKDLKNLIKGVNLYNSHRVMFCTDDKHPEDLLKDGHIDFNIKLAIKNGVDPITAVQMATINAAGCYNLKKTGAIAPGYKADMIVVDDLNKFNVLEVYKDGKLAAKNKEALFTVENTDASKVLNTVHLSKINKENLDIVFDSKIDSIYKKVNVIGIQSHSLITKKLIRNIETKGNKFEYDKEKDLLKIAVIERHHNTHNIGLGLVENFKLRNGAIATTIAHDSHNLIVIGDNDDDMVNASNKVIEMNGGIAISSGNCILESLPLEIGGLMSNEDIEYVDTKIGKMVDIAYNKLNVNKDIDPFLTLGFLALPVIPEIKITDKGLFSVSDFKFIDIEYNK